MSAEDNAISKRRKDLAKKGYRTEKALDAEEARKAAAAQKKKKNNKKLWIAGGLLLLVLLMMFACGPAKGTAMYGICRTFLELYLKYPTTLGISYVEQYDMAVRIGYTHTDAFGQYSLNMMECAFRQDPNMGLALDSVLYNRKPLDPAMVADFNATVPTVLAFPADLRLPPPLGTTLMDLKKGE